MKTFNLKIKAADVTSNNYAQELGVRNPKLIYIDEEGEAVKKVRVVMRRTFSVGYSAGETSRLEECTEIVNTYTIHPNGITRKVEGRRNTEGAFEGYYLASISINGNTSGGGYGDADEAERIYSTMKLLYDEQ